MGPCHTVHPHKSHRTAFRVRLFGDQVSSSLHWRRYRVFLARVWFFHEDLRRTGPIPAPKEGRYQRRGNSTFALLVTSRNHGRHPQKSPEMPVMSPKQGRHPHPVPHRASFPVQDFFVTLFLHIGNHQRIMEKHITREVALAVSCVINLGGNGAVWVGNCTEAGIDYTEVHEGDLHASGGLSLIVSGSGDLLAGRIDSRDFSARCSVSCDDFTAGVSGSGHVNL